MSKKPPKKPLRVAELKAHLSAYLREVRAGRELTVYDRDTPIARIVPVTLVLEPLVTRKPTRRWEDVPIPPAPKKPIDSLSVLLELRRDRFP